MAGLKEDWGTYLSQAVGQFLQSHQAYKQMFMQQKAVDMEREKLAIEKEKVKLEQKKAIFDFGPGIATIMGMPVSMSDVGKFLGVDTSKMPKEKETKTKKTVAGIEGKGGDVSYTVEKEMMFKPIPSDKKSGVRPLNSLEAATMKMAYSNLTPEYIMARSFDYSTDPAMTMEKFDKMFKDSNDAAKTTGQTFHIPQITLEQAREYTKNVYKYLTPEFIVDVSSSFSASPQDDPKKLYDTLENNNNTVRLGLDVDGTPKDPTTYGLDLVAKNTQTARSRAGVVEGVNLFNTDQKKLMDQIFERLTNESIASINASPLYDDAFKKNVTKQLLASSSDRYYNKLLDDYKEVRAALPKEYKDEKMLAADLLNGMKAKGYRFYNTTDMNVELKYASGYVKGMLK